jgi:hypothetical protein
MYCLSLRGEVFLAQTTSFCPERTKKTKKCAEKGDGGSCRCLGSVLCCTLVLQLQVFLIRDLDPRKTYTVCTYITCVESVDGCGET